ncbi:hypothetical protein Psed_0862 [Pseudonocardia dioxanivorans CB1190]|uniref:Uncharacterized protein n=1 Tax=Pseudonocardia dioxanivorans (strain ATCC 55486 / DSM 44775 / JCM 13855 / CB1190) TaxID=675635 RepID=F4CSE2_PSEUX|nr:hypothetical protein [Pseudonocardia dioxanivorans]AEA23116.1 hypothetical protein Psed_0862 [Pseudonocardia dioxanivorans CB1190]
MFGTVTTVPTTTAVYRFAVDRDGGGVGYHQLDGDPIPAGALVVDALARIERKFGPAEPPQARSPLRLAVVLGGGVLLPPVGMGALAAPGQVLRSELPARARVLVANGERPAVAVEGSVGFATGGLLLAVTWLHLDDS